MNANRVTPPLRFHVQWVRDGGMTGSSSSDSLLALANEAIAGEGGGTASGGGEVVFGSSPPPSAEKLTSPEGWLRVLYHVWDTLRYVFSSFHLSFCF